MSIPLENIRAIARERHAATIAFAQQIIQIPSLPGREKEVAAAITYEMQNLGYDEVWTDEVGNVIGKINGGAGPVVLLNGHMDHVDPGPAQGWPYPPFSGQIIEGELWGRGAVDMKGPLACMIYAASLFKQMDFSPPGDILMTVPVMEEVGGVGTHYLTSHLQADVAICGEPSRNILRRGHRGRVGLQVTFKGRSAHASTPQLGLNPHYRAAAFLSKLPDLAMAEQAGIGVSSVVPTLYTTDQTSSNVIPGEVYLTLDWRNVPAESPEAILQKVRTLLAGCLAETGAGGEGEAVVEITGFELMSYTGKAMSLPDIFPSFLLAEDNPLLQAAHAMLVKVLGRDEGVDIWRFATDGGHLMAAGIPTVGFGPGDERLAHTNQERISLAQMEEAVVAYAALILALGEQAILRK
ncbi:MAG: M20/M25/M40 family metallo-hydrolase [Anaerolineae bacterium]|nr:M20/M25/M40 family metallo-hydrolase [Anaerolineae bacterium]